MPTNVLLNPITSKYNRVNLRGEFNFAWIFKVWFVMRYQREWYLMIVFSYITTRVDFFIIFASRRSSQKLEVERRTQKC
jgi:hypothetical protein